MKQPSQQVASAWAPIVGRWTVGEKGVVYNGPQEGTGHPFGICLSNLRFTEGTTDVSVVLSPGTSGRVLFGYRSLNETYWTAGLGGYGASYVFSKFEPSLGWRPTSVLGSQSNLEFGKNYRIEAKLAGQRLYLTIDGVRVLEHVPQQPLTSGQLGLFAWGSGEVRFSPVVSSQFPPTVFVVMQFSEQYKQLYSEVIQPVASEFDLKPFHVGEVQGPGVILNDIVQGLIEAKVVIAEVTPPNQNVFFELGYAHALGKPTILLAERGKQLPFDITGYRCLFYENTIGGKKQVEEALRKHLSAILHE
jgi:hypothetical protein